MPPPSSPPSRLPSPASSSKTEPLAFSKSQTVASPPRIIINAVEGWGKTSLGSFAPKPAILMTNDETGYFVLRESGLVPEVATAVTSAWPETLATLDALAIADKGPETLVLDAMTGFERLCQRHVCATQFKRTSDGELDWGEKGFGSYAKGYELTSIEWVNLLAKLDMVRAAHKCTIILLSHCKIRPFKNPEGPDFDRYASNVHEKIWDTTKQWADAVLFGNFLTAVSDEKKRKAVGGDTRVLYATRSAAYDAKNRYGMESIIQMPNDHSQMWNAVATAMKRKV